MARDRLRTSSPQSPEMSAEAERCRIRVALKALWRKWDARSVRGNADGWTDIEGALRARFAIEEAIKATYKPRRRQTPRRGHADRRSPERDLV